MVSLASQSEAGVEAADQSQRLTPSSLRGHTDTGVVMSLSLHSLFFTFNSSHSSCLFALILLTHLPKLSTLLRVLDEFREIKLLTFYIFEESFVKMT